MPAATFTIPSLASLSWTDGFAADYIAPSEIGTRVDYEVKAPDASVVASGQVNASQETSVTLTDPALGDYEVSFVATHFDAIGDGQPSAPLVETVSVSDPLDPLPRLGVEIAKLVNAMPPDPSLPSVSDDEKIMTFAGSNVVTGPELKTAGESLGFDIPRSFRKLKSMAFWARRDSSLPQYVMGAPHFLTNGAFWSSGRYMWQDDNRFGPNWTYYWWEGNSPVDENWSHYAFTYEFASFWFDPNYFRVYQNGQLAFTEPFFDRPIWWNEPKRDSVTQDRDEGVFTIGGLGNSHDEWTDLEDLPDLFQPRPEAFFVGEMADARIATVMWTDQEVLDIYNSYFPLSSYTSLDKRLTPLAGTAPRFPTKDGDDFVFDGSSNFFRLIDLDPTNDSLGQVVKSNTFSITMWVLIDPDVMFQYRILQFQNSFGVGVGPEDYLLMIYEGFNLWFDQSNNYTNPPFSPPYSTWLHIALTNDAGNIVMFVNNTIYYQPSETLQSMPNANDGAGMHIGAGSFFGSFNVRFFKGRMRDMRLYDRALSPSQVQAVYASTQP